MEIPVVNNMIGDRLLYFVRHGETELNKLHIRQGPDGGLSSLGVQQVRLLADRLKKIKIKRIIHSTYERAIQTANIINDVNNVKIFETDLIVERKNPSIIVGKPYEDPIAKNFIQTMDNSYHLPELRLYDEENFEDLRDRAIKARKFLEANTINKTVVVTHGVFLKMFLSVILYGEKLSVSDWVKMNYYNPSDNAALTVVVYNPIKRFLGFGKSWRILAFNDSTR